MGDNYIYSLISRLIMNPVAICVGWWLSLSHFFCVPQFKSTSADFRIHKSSRFVCDFSLSFLKKKRRGDTKNEKKNLTRCIVVVCVLCEFFLLLGVAVKNAVVVSLLCGLLFLGSYWIFSDVVVVESWVDVSGSRSLGVLILHLVLVILLLLPFDLIA